MTEYSQKIRVNRVQEPLVRIRVKPRVPPLEIELQNTGTEIQWRVGTTGTWQTLVEIDDIDASITVGSVTTLAPGASATVTNVGTAQNAVLDFGLPAGFDGLMTSIVAGLGISVDSTDPANPILTAAVQSVAALTGAISAAGLKTALAIAVADITDASANGRSLISAANYAAMKTLLAVSKSDVGLGNVDNTSDATKNAATATLTNKRVTPRVTTITSSASPTVNTDNTDIVNITALAAAITSMTTNLSGTPGIGDVLVYQIKDNGTARAITWGASFTAKGVALPTTTVISKLLTVSFMWNGSNWGCVGSAQEA